MSDEDRHRTRPAPDQQPAAGPPPTIRTRSFNAPESARHVDSELPVGPPAGPTRRGRRPAMIGLAAVIAAVVVTGIVVVTRSGPSAPGVAATAIGGAGVTTSMSLIEPDVDVVKALLQRRAHALLAGDEAAWLADIDPKATDLIAREKMRFANLRQLGLKTYDQIPYGLSTGSGPMPVGEVMQLNADVERSETVADWDMAYDGKRLQITGVQPSRYLYGVQQAVPHPPWDDVPLRSATADGITILAPAAGAGNPATYLPAARKAASIVRSLWGKRRGVPGFVVFLANHQQFTTWLHPDGSKLTNAIGVTTFPRMVEADGRNRFAQPDLKNLHKPVYEPEYLERGAGARIVLDMTAVHGTREVEQTLTHEFTHAMSPNLIQTQNLDFNAGGGPSIVNQATWPIEGFARYVEYLDNPPYAAQAMLFVRQNRSAYHPAGPFPASKGFYDGNANRGEFNYDLSSSMFLAAQKVGGPQKAINLYIALTNNGDALTDTETFVNPLLEQVGLSPSKVWSAQQTLTGH